MAWSFNPTPANPITTYTVAPYTMLISSTTNADAGTYSATLTNGVTYGGQSFLPSVTFDVVVTDPCLTTAITSFSIADFSQETGVSVDTAFTEPDDSAASAVGNLSICGPKTYTVVNSDGTA